MRRTTKLMIVAGAVCLAMACTNSGLQGQTTLDSGVTTAGTGPGGGPGGTGTGTGSGGNTCDWEGTWAVSTAWCGAFEIDNDWFAVYSDTTMTITDAGGGACAVSFNWTGAECAEDESWEITSSTSDTWSISFGGIDSCSPAACTFFGNDDTCAEGDRSQATPIDFDVEVLQDTQVRITGLFGDESLWASSGYPQCTLDLTTEWIKQ